MAGDNLPLDILLRFWGKARPETESAEPRYHPLAYHSLDVAAVGDLWLAQDESLRRQFAYWLGIPPERVAALLTPLLALHDIGKFAWLFQAKASKIYDPNCFNGKPHEAAPSYRHDIGGYAFLDRELRNSDLFYSLLPLCRAVTGHHGIPPKKETLSDRGYTKEGLKAARAFRDAIESFLPWPESGPDEEAAKRSATLVAGFAIVCDWLGSNQIYFPYEAPEFSLKDYWDRTREEKADRAITEAGLIAARSAGAIALPALLGKPETECKPTPMQDWAMEVALPETGPVLALIEDQTGSGKTEAALLLASRLMARGGESGYYFALPTMATANALFDRLSKTLPAFFAAETKPSAILAHGHAHLRERNFRAIELTDTAIEQDYGEGEEETAGRTGRAWLQDDRRKTFLADIGIGTIDQAMLSILPARFQALRRFGLSRRILIVDEIHAYDAYVGMAIEDLIRWQKASGGSVILLSATLPDRIKEKILRAFSGNAERTALGPEAAPYPLATLMTPTSPQPKLEPVAGAPGTEKRVEIAFAEDYEHVLAYLIARAKAGEAVAYIRNSVDDAIEAWQALRDRGQAAMLFHARMAFIDRDRVEREVLKVFGKDSRQEDRAGKILIATQVIEQSLDLDFDAMASDLAPIDLLIQRAGRLWRHRRKGRDGRPELLIFGPAPYGEIDADWLKRLLKRSAYVYKDHARLWLTADILQKRGAIKSPGAIRDLIESVYSLEAEESVPHALHASLLSREGKDSAKRSIAGGIVLRPEDGYIHEGPWINEARISTRLEEGKRIILRLARIDERHAIRPYAEQVIGTDGIVPKDPEACPEAWALSEVAVAAGRFIGANSAGEDKTIPDLIPDGLEDAAEKIRRSWGHFDQGKVLVVLHRDSANETFAAGGVGYSATPPRIAYSPESGLTFTTGEHN